MDRLTPEQRRKNMQAVRNKDSKIEISLRKKLFAKGYRYRKNFSGLPGHPDIVFTKQKIAIFCDSEFWHGFNWNETNRNIKSKRDFWIPKIQENIERDKKTTVQLESQGFLVLRFWGKQIQNNLDNVVEEIETAITSRKGKERK